MQVNYPGPIKVISNAVVKAGELLNNKSFYGEIASQPIFDYADCESSIIADIIQSSSISFTVKTFHPTFWEWNVKKKYRKTNAYVRKRVKNTLFLNDRKLHRSVEEIAATIIHESVHAVDNSTSEYSFGHGDNNVDGKEKSAPYWIGNLAYRLLTGNERAALLPFYEIEEY